ncbi:MAG: NAD(P)/FAD-dependent oxidoreductase [Acidobacteriales bacterium]|nr:NAD(P)/FAD-dependent oxidoreductase [Terriglobales bacterium]
MPAKTARVIGAGPNGLAAAIVLAQAGLPVEVLEAEAIPGGGARTMELTLPGFLHDAGSAVHPFAAGSPFFTSLPLHQHGLEWIHSPAPLAHPFDDDTAIVLERSLGDAVREFGRDGESWRRLVGPLARNWDKFVPDVLGPIVHIPRHPFLLASFGWRALQPAMLLANTLFADPRTRALFAGCAAHSFLGLTEPLSSSFGTLLGAAAHAPGWPIPRGGAQAITNALISYLSTLGGTVQTSHRVRRLSDLVSADITVCDVSPPQLLAIAGNRLSPTYRRALESQRRGPGSFKVDYALSSPIPWTATDCARAATIHLGGSAEEIATSEAAMRNNQHAERPFMIISQPTLFDPTRAPEGKHVAWAYCHVPSGSTFDMLERLENQIERFAPGFRDCILARRVFSPAGLESMNLNLTGGDILGGSNSLMNLLFRPTLRGYPTSAPDIFLCSSSTPPGGGVHGMCGYHAAKTALRSLRIPFGNLTIQGKRSP